MNAAYLHLATTHLPVIGTLFGLCLLVYGILRKSEELKRTALLALFLTALCTLPAYLSGTPATGVLKRAAPGLPMDPMEQHAEVAIIALTGSLIVGVVSLLGLVCFRKTKTSPRSYLALVFFLACVSLGLMSWTANLGGKIRHPEIRSISSIP